MINTTLTNTDLETSSTLHWLLQYTVDEILRPRKKPEVCSGGSRPTAAIAAADVLAAFQHSLQGGVVVKALRVRWGRVGGELEVPRWSPFPQLLAIEVSLATSHDVHVVHLKDLSMSWDASPVPVRIPLPIRSLRVGIGDRYVCV